MKNKKLTIALIIGLCIITLLLSSSFISALLGTNRGFSLIRIINLGHKISNNLVIEEEYNNIFKTIEINSKASDIDFYTGNDNEIKVKIYGNEKDINIENKNDKLSIKTTAHGCIGICVNLTIPKIEVYLPSNYDNSVTINNDYGDIEIDNFPYMTLNATLNAGDIKVMSVQFGKIHNDYGDINVIKYSKELNIKQNCGDVNVGEVDNISVSNSLGDINIDKVNTYLNISSKLGDVTIDKVNIQTNSQIDSKLGDVSIRTTNDIKIDAKTQLGDTNIRKSNNSSNIILIIKNSLGDITVN